MRRNTAWVLMGAGVVGSVLAPLIQSAYPVLAGGWWVWLVIMLLSLGALWTGIWLGRASSETPREGSVTTHARSQRVFRPDWSQAAAYLGLLLLVWAFGTVMLHFQW